MKGRRLRARLRNFRPALDSYVTSLGGPLPYMQRLREIDERTERWLGTLEAAWHELAKECDGGTDAFEHRWSERAESYDFGEINDLVERHNRFFPAEARLPVDVRRRDFVLIGGQHYRRPFLDASWVLERFPSDLEVVRDRAGGRPGTRPVPIEPGDREDGAQTAPASASSRRSSSVRSSSSP